MVHNYEDRSFLSLLEMFPAFDAVTLWRREISILSLCTALMYSVLIAHTVDHRDISHQWHVHTHSEISP